MHIWWKVFLFLFSFFGHLVIYTIVKELTWLEKPWEAMGSKNIILSKFFSKCTSFPRTSGCKKKKTIRISMLRRISRWGSQAELFCMRNHFVKHLFYYFQSSLHNFPIFFSHSQCQWAMLYSHHRLKVISLPIYQTSVTFSEYPQKRSHT